VLDLVLLLLAATHPAEGHPLFYWGARPPIVTADRSSEKGVEARVVEVHAAVDSGGLVLRFSFDRGVAEALYLPDGAPVSGRLRASLYIDADDDRATGFDAGGSDLRTGADDRVDIGSVSLGEDAEEQRPASVLVAATVYSLTREGRRRTLWRGDDESAPRRVSAHGEWVEVRLPPDALAPRPRARLILVTPDGPKDGRLVSSPGP
jgi:hypothetical protein